ncbi:MAG: hypothetical protein C4527_05405 [Candidatus Omnitrophota bacterium]|jgi:hypothetical protein|nr:MAG: hypothetical protein C4527_05405 [Candidatus Omnitrophota bacterium]
MKKRTFSVRKTVVFAMIGLTAMAGLSAWSQETGNMFTTPDGKMWKTGPDTDWSADNPLSSTATFYLFPQEGHATAHVVIVDGTKETHGYGKKITYYSGTGSFLLEGNARIEQGGDFLEGSVSINYDAVKKEMNLKGTDKQPAQLSYRGGSIKSSALEISIVFGIDYGDVKFIKTHKNKSTQIEQEKSKTQAPPKRKMSSPR